MLRLKRVANTRSSSLLKNGAREGEAPAEPRETSDFPHAHGSAGVSPSLFQQAANTRMIRLVHEHTSPPNHLPKLETCANNMRRFHRGGCKHNRTSVRKTQSPENSPLFPPTGEEPRTTSQGYRYRLFQIGIPRSRSFSVAVLEFDVSFRILRPRRSSVTVAPNTPDSTSRWP